MFSGGGGLSWDALKAATAPLNLLVNWVPQWTRSAAEYRELGRSCFGWFGMLLALNLVSAVMAGFLIVGAFQKIRPAMAGILRSPRAAFQRAPATLFLTTILLVPLLFALISGKPFHARYCLVLLAPLLALAGAGAQHWLGSLRVRRFFLASAAITTLANVWFMAAFYRHQGTRIQEGELFIPSFRQLESVYQRLKQQAGPERRVVVDDTVYLAAFPKSDGPHRDVALIRRYVNVREKESALRSPKPPAQLIFTLIPAAQTNAAPFNAAYNLHGIALIAAESLSEPAKGEQSVQRR
jgi:hypothetical protein